jgi:hypothetical protein
MYNYIMCVYVQVYLYCSYDVTFFRTAFPVPKMTYGVLKFVNKTSKIWAGMQNHTVYEVSHSAFFSYCLKRFVLCHAESTAKNC